MCKIALVNTIYFTNCFLLMFIVCYFVFSVLLDAKLQIFFSFRDQLRYCTHVVSFINQLYQGYGK